MVSNVCLPDMNIAEAENIGRTGERKEAKGTSLPSATKIPTQSGNFKGSKTDKG